MATEFGDRVVALARNWIGTPYRHQATVKGAGTDCLGLVRGVWRELIGPEVQSVPAYTPDWSDASREEVLWAAAQRHLIEKSPSSMAPGDVLLFRMKQGRIAKHVGILACPMPEPTFIHAYTGHAVVESALSRPWQKAVVACFSFPSGDT